MSVLRSTVSHRSNHPQPISRARRCSTECTQGENQLKNEFIAGPRLSQRRREPSCCLSEILENLCRRTRSIQRVEVQPWRTFSQELFTLERRVLDAELYDLLIITAGFQAADDDGGQIGAAERHETLDL